MSRISIGASVTTCPDCKMHVEIDEIKKCCSQCGLKYSSRIAEGKNDVSAWWWYRYYWTKDKHVSIYNWKKL